MRRYGLKIIKNNKYITELFTYRIFVKLLKYIVSGIISSGTGMILIILFTEVFKIYYILSNVINNIFQFVISFLLVNIWTFQSSENIFKQINFRIVYFVTDIIAASVLMYILTDIIGFIYPISKIIIGGISSSVFFVLMNIRTGKSNKTIM